MNTLRNKFRRSFAAVAAVVALTGGLSIVGAASVAQVAGAATCSTNGSAGSFNAGTSTVSITPGTNGSTTSGLPGGCSPLTNYVTDTVYGPTTATITITIKDASGNPVSGQAVQINPAGSSSAVVTTVTGTTGTNGQAVFTMSDPVNQTVTYTASDITACNDQSRDGCVYGGSYNGTSDTSPLDDGELFTAMQITFAAGYSVSYNANGGTGTTPTDSTVYANGASVTLPSASGLTPPAGCSSFEGWSNNANYPTAGTLYTVPGTFTINATTALYAIWNCTTYTITYFANGATGTVPVDTNTYPTDNPGTVLSGSSLTPPAGCTFAGWSTDPSATTPDPAYAVGASVTVTGDLALYAVFSCTYYNVTYDANGGGGTPPTDPNNYASGETVTVLGGSNLTYGGGCSFIGWDPSSTASTPTYPSNQSNTFTITGNVTLYAVYGNCGWDVTYDPGAGSGSVVDPNAPYLDGTYVTVLAGTGLVAPTGEEFVGWTYTSGQTTPDIYPNQTFAIHADTVLFAVYDVTLSFDPGTGSGSITAQSQIVPGTTVSLPANQDGLVAPANQQFNGWNCGDVSYAAGASFTITGDTTCTAQWAAIPVTLTIDTKGEGAVSEGGHVFVQSGNGHSATTHNKGSYVTVVASPLSGFSVTWGGACANATGNRCSVAMTSSRNVTVSFSPNVVLPVFFFAVDQWSIHLTALQYNALVKDLRVLDEAGLHNLTLTGYADIRSTVSHNSFLGHNRSVSVENYLNAIAKRFGFGTFQFVLRDGGQTTQFGPSYQANRRTTVTYTVQ